MQEHSKKYVIDVDGVVATITRNMNYAGALPIVKNIDKINKLYDNGHEIVMFTARGTETGINWRKVTEFQFNSWGLKYHKLIFGKPAADYYIDDKLISIEEI